MYRTLQFIFILTLALCISACNNKTETEQTTVRPPITTAKELRELTAQLAKDSTNADLYYARAKYYMNIRDFNAALVDMSSVMHLDTTKPEYYLTLSDLYMFTNRTSKSKAVLETCITLDPKNTDARLKLAELYFYVKKYQESINYINDALKIDKYISKAYFLKGMNFKELGDTAKAVSSMITATEQDPEYYSAYLELGVMAAAKKDKLAISYYDNALRIEPKSIEALYNKGKFYQDIRDYDNAISTYQHLLTSEPQYKYAEYNLGAIALLQKKNEEAIKHFTNAINIDAKFIEAYFARGTCYMQKNDKVSAKADFQMATRLDANYQPAQNALRTIRE